jgi:hypothetical protein
MRSHLIHSVSLGLLLAFSSLASANSNARPAAHEVNAQRNLFQKHIDLHKALENDSGEDFEVLRQHTRKVVSAWTGRSHVTLLNRSKGKLTFDGYYFRVEAPNGTAEHTSVNNVSALGIMSAHDYHATIQRHLLDSAGMIGHELTPANVAKAHEILHRQIADVDRMSKYLEEPSTHEDIDKAMQFLLALGGSRGSTYKMSKPFILAEKDGETIQVVPSGNRRGVLPAPEYKLVRVGKDQQAATLDVLTHFGLGTVEELNAAVHRAMLSVYAPEDTPLHTPGAKY